MGQEILDPGMPFMIIPEFVYRSSEIGCVEKMLLGVIFGMGGGIGDCTESDAAIGQRLDMSEEETGTMIADLMSRRFLADVGSSQRALFVTNPDVEYPSEFRR